MRIHERQDSFAEARGDWIDLGAVFLEPLSPELEAFRRHFEPDFDRQAMPGARRRHLRPREKRQIGAWMAFLIGVEEVIGAGVVLVDALLDQPHAEHAAVEVEVLLRGPGDGGDVMKSVDGAHVLILDRLWSG